MEHHKKRKDRAMGLIWYQVAFQVRSLKERKLGIDRDTRVLNI